MKTALGMNPRAALRAIKTPRDPVGNWVDFNDL